MFESPEAIKQCIEFLDNHIQMIRGVYADVGEDDNHCELILALRIFRADLRRRAKNVPVTLDWLSSLNHGGRVAANILENLCELEAEALGDWDLGQTAQNHQQGLAGILVVLIKDLYQQITEAEKLYPERTEEFEVERVGYYALKRAVEEVDRVD
jgi:hypothetical protein